MKITIICSDYSHPVYDRLYKWKNEMLLKDHDVDIVKNPSELTSGDILFLISCSDIVKNPDYKHCLVIHASDLPEGRGWSPMIWDILEGKNNITISMIEASEPVDSGRILKKEIIHFEGHELYNELNDKLFDCEIRLMDYAVSNELSFVEQCGKSTYYRKRTPEDSRIDIEKPLVDQFNLLRVCDPDRYPAFFDYMGHRYKIKIEHDS